MDFSNLAERRAVTQIAMKLRKLWGKLRSLLALVPTWSKDHAQKTCL